MVIFSLPPSAPSPFSVLKVPQWFLLAFEINTKF